MAMLQRKKRVRFTLDVNFANEAGKDAFCDRLRTVRDQLTPVGSPALNNYELLLALFDLAANRPCVQPNSSSGSFLKNAGKIEFGRCDSERSNRKIITFIKF